MNHYNYTKYFLTENKKESKFTSTVIHCGETRW
jgi:hypothetical protein